MVYLAASWLGIALMLPLIWAFDLSSIAYCLTGAALYSLGSIFYTRSHRWHLAHGIWHAFVVGGAAAHFFMFFTVLKEIKVNN